MTEKGFDRLRPVQEVLKDVVYVWKSMDPEVDGDIKILVTTQSEKLMMEKLTELQTQQHIEFL